MSDEGHAGIKQVSQRWWSPPPRYLFKYRTVDSQDIELTFTESKAFFPCPRDFNDPFDFRPNILPADREERARIVERSAINKGLSRTHRHKAVRWSRRQDVKSMVQQSVTKTVNGYGVYSLSERADELLMWSYYANGHKGFCLIFSATEYPFWLSLPVYYRDEYPTVRAIDIGYDLDTYYKLILTKSSHWKHERERRLVTFPEQPRIPKLVGSGRGWHEFPAESLVGVILGAKMSSDDKRIVRGWCAQSPKELQVHQAHIDDDDYQVNIVPPIDG